MKDYYQILGLERSATQEEIKKAYKKLAFKFHPDRNQGDPFFENMFRQVKEAYDTLGDTRARADYDLKLKGSGGRTSVSEPVITQFAADKSQIYPGDTVTFFWNVENADAVRLHPFGPVASFGRASYRLKNFSGPTLDISITAFNRASGRTVRRTLTLHNLASHRRATRPAQHSERGFIAPPNYLTYALLTTFFCCLPLGIASIVNSVQVNNRWKKGDYEGAVAASQAARNWALAALIVGVIVNIFLMLGALD